MGDRPALPVVDVNADLGEGFGVWRLGDDEALLDVVTSANVACGFHAGDPLTLRRVTEQAAARGVRVGAQVSYRDLAGFGRRAMDVPAAELTAEILYQIGALDGLCRVAGTRVHYVKAHGALNNRMVWDEEQAQATVDAIRAYDPALPLLVLPGSALERCATEAGLVAVREGYADRGYTPQGTLVPRREPGAVLTDPADVIQRVRTLVRDGTVTAVDGTEIPLAVRSICVHGDTPGAVALARAVRDTIAAVGASVEAFA
ncbi:hypothetical protein TH66_15890 [Carbonactinospora thermoautotrophica]|uniref:5-oxoprolinase subunit A n=1 Tax=Carbonactinospora thermoautotrophica TaxID=1469144 RepID=A0A132NE29_9ACTN|nr:5-oxoprolinase subunit PxpA [Carbonactinospora thermoautotrophica]KWX00313.1 hypothetical protein TH66_15890 [Carbonactinospora thermoautotrophica]KWX07852.1 hypothetical protein TR74_17365 [Carbonactinospora thermoautotrophica]